ncbi:hypothetical protein HK102_001133 [Quaeritorhiza haematococci]|nr:hypothetical protein HK102_001133 [Quaeritorhiza haematococci]
MRVRRVRRSISESPSSDIPPATDAVVLQSSASETNSVDASQPTSDPSPSPLPPPPPPPPPSPSPPPSTNGVHHIMQTTAPPRPVPSNFNNGGGGGSQPQNPGPDNDVNGSEQPNQEQPPPPGGDAGGVSSGGRPSPIPARSGSTPGVTRSTGNGTSTSNRNATNTVNPTQTSGINRASTIRTSNLASITASVSPNPTNSVEASADGVPSSSFRLVAIILPILAILLLASAIWFFCCRRRKNGKAARSDDEDDDSSASSKGTWVSNGGSTWKTFQTAKSVHSASSRSNKRRSSSVFRTQRSDASKRSRASAVWEKFDFGLLTAGTGTLGRLLAGPGSSREEGDRDRQGVEGAGMSRSPVEDNNVPYNAAAHSNSSIPPPSSHHLFIPHDAVENPVTPPPPAAEPPTYSAANEHHWRNDFSPTTTSHHQLNHHQLPGSLSRAHAADSTHHYPDEEAIMQMARQSFHRSSAFLTSSSSSWTSSMISTSSVPSPPSSPFLTHFDQLPKDVAGGDTHNSEGSSASEQQSQSHSILFNTLIRNLNMQAVAGSNIGASGSSVTEDSAPSHTYGIPAATTAVGGTTRWSFQSSLSHTSTSASTSSTDDEDQPEDQDDDEPLSASISAYHDPQSQHSTSTYHDPVSPQSSYSYDAVRRGSTQSETNFEFDEARMGTFGHGARNVVNFDGEVEGEDEQVEHTQVGAVKGRTSPTWQNKALVRPRFSEFSEDTFSEEGDSEVQSRQSMDSIGFESVRSSLAEGSVRSPRW